MAEEPTRQDLVEMEAQSEKEPQPDPKPPTTPSLGPPPNGGLTAWLQVFGSFLIAMNNWFVDEACAELRLTIANSRPGV